MATKSFKVSFDLDESDVAYFRGLYNSARKKADEADRGEIIQASKELIKSVRESAKTPSFVREAASSLEDLIGMVQDEAYALPASIVNQAVAALAYFVNPEDLIPDDVPGLGLLDDAIMIKIVENEFEDDLWGYRKFRKFRAGAEQRPWTGVAKTRLPKRLAEERRKIRADVAKRKERRKARDEATRKKAQRKARQAAIIRR